MRQPTYSRWRLWAIVGGAIVTSAVFAAAGSASAKGGVTRSCKTIVGGQVICGDLVIGITLEQYQAGLKKRAEEIRREEAKRRIELQELFEKQMELTERATGAEKESLRNKIAAVEAGKRRLEAESKGVADRLRNLQASYDGLVQKLAEANAALEEFGPLISREEFEQAQAMLRRGDVLGAERKFVEIADKVRKIRERAKAVEARAIFQAGNLAEERIDWRAAYVHYARAARLQPKNWRYARDAGILASRMGDYAAAVSFNEVALDLAIAEFGADASETATALNNLAETYQALARYGEAEPLYRQAIAISEKALGKNHPTVASCYNNLAGLLHDQGRFDEAEPFYRRAIEISERTLGKEHPNVAVWYNNLAGLLRYQGKHAEAERLYRRAMVISEKALGKDHPTVATKYNNLANLLAAQRKYAEAEPLYRQAIAIDEKALGKEHPKFVAHYNNLASMLQAQGKIEEAARLHRQAIEIGENTLGKEHPEVAASYNNLASLFKSQRKYAEAEQLYQRAIKILNTKLGPEHPNTILVKRNYDGLRRLKDRRSATSGQ